MSLRERIVEQLRHFDDEAFVALANRGLLRRAQKDLEKLEAQVLEEGAEALIVGFGEQRIRFDARGPAHAQCSCPASGVCQHILAAAIMLQRSAEAAPAPAASNESSEKGVPQAENEPSSPALSPASSPAALETAEAPATGTLACLQAELLAIPAAELLKHAGKAGYRWAWQFVADLDPEQGLQISGERYLILGFAHPRLSLRYMGGSLDSLIADVDTKQIEKYRVAAVLAYRRANGLENPPPEAPGKAQTTALDLGKDHNLAQLPAEALEESRRRLRASALQLFQESVELGLAHLSQGIYERYSTLAVWAQGAEYYRLALLLRHLADHVELLLERAGGADEHRLFDELTLTFGLVSALEQNAAKGLAPAALVGRARSRYEEMKTVELLGLGASAWRSAAGYVGLTMIFWSPRDRTFFSCADVRPESQRNFNPLARYKAAGPWGGLGAPAQATGRYVALTGAQINAAGRLSAAESTSAAVRPLEKAEDLAAQLDPFRAWSEIARQRTEARRSLLSEPQPMKDWAVLQPARFGAASFDKAQQKMVWPLFDEEERALVLELPFNDFTSHAIGRIEQLTADDLQAGTLVVARLRSGASGLTGEPMSLIRANPRAQENPVDALVFDEAPKQGFASKWLMKLLGGNAARDGAQPLAAAVPLPAVLLEFRHWLQRQAERGMAEDQTLRVKTEMGVWAERATVSGLSVFLRGLPQAAEAGGAGALLLRAHYIWLQYERLMGSAPEESD